MKLPISWLSKWVRVDAEPKAIAEALTQRGFYVEGVEVHGHDYPGVVVGFVIDVQKHPNADKLSLCRVHDGTQELRVVCGAPNVRAGMLAPLARVGAVLPGGLQIKKSKIRGETSEGMLCSGRELGLSEDHGGILDLAEHFGRTDLAAGEPVSALFGPPETVLEVEIPFNRPDGLGIVGLAREVKAALDGEWTNAARKRLAARPDPGTAFDLEIDPEGCPRYFAWTLENVRIGSSPGWLRNRLEAAGQRSINNVVDATNYVLFELGQPIHAFDLDRVAGEAIRVRRARQGERITTLDGKERVLGPEVLVIADIEKPVGLAGIMGGADSEVRADSSRLLLEVATFDPKRIRRGSRFLGLTTEASKRFERGVDPGIVPAAAERFVDLLSEISPGLRLGPGRFTGGPPVVARPIPLRLSRCNRLIGMPVTPADAARRLGALEFGVRGNDPIEVTVPSFRVDVTIEDDLVEEVARATGYDTIPLAPVGAGSTRATRSARERVIRSARDGLLARGFFEATTTTLVSSAEARQAAALTGLLHDRLIQLENPMSREGEVLRPNLAPGLLRACAHNLRQGASSVRLFEVGNGFAWGEDGETRPVETLMVAAVLTGDRWAHAHDAAPGAVDFADARGLWEAWLEEMGVDTPEWRPYSAAGWKPGASAEVAVAASRIGWAGVLSSTLLREWEIEVPVHVFMVNLGSIHESRPAGIRARLPGRFPPVRRDLAFFVPASVPYARLERSILEGARERLSSVELFDVYTGPGTPEGMKGMAFALQFVHPERTMTEVEILAIHDRIVAAVAKDCGGRLRER